jgi:methionyl-tRNA formyltransferase
MSAPRTVVVSTVLPVVERLVEALRALGHEPVAWLSARRTPGPRAPQFPNASDEVAPAGLDILLVTQKHAIEPLVAAYAPDLLLCWGFPWKIPLAALELPPLGSVNLHTGLLPRHRGPVPLAWALREGDSHFGVTWHRMDAELDTGPILAQGVVPIDEEDTTIDVIGPKLLGAALDLLPHVLELVARGNPGTRQPSEGATWAGHFGEDYATIDLSSPARSLHDQVRAWRLAFGLGPVAGPILELDGERLLVLRTSLSDPGRHARRVEAGDGPLWIVETEPAEPG